MRKVKLSPSMMCANFLNIKEELDVFQKCNIDFLHIDIMDGHYVPNYTLGIDFCKSLKSYSSIPLDIHLMIDNVDQYIDTFCQYEGSWVSFHPETTWHPVRTIEQIKKHNCKVGIALDSATSIEKFSELYPLIDFVLIMTVTPGYAGQKVLLFCIEKIAKLRDYFVEQGIEADIEVDGNVSWEHIPTMIQAGATILVNGSASIFDKQYSREEAIAKVRELIDKLN
jgi:ribulose-phosphate 3-epimerase